MEWMLPPALIIIAAGLSALFLRGNVRTAVLVIAPLLALIMIWSLPLGNHGASAFLGLEHQPFVLDKLSRLFGTVFCLTASLGALFAASQTSTLEKCSAFIYAGAALGVVFAGDWLTLFIYWEVMAVGSALVIFAGGADAKAAGLRYIAIHFLGGVLLMAGVAGEIVVSGSSLIAPIQPDSLMRWLLLGGILINAAAPPFNAWLPDAYPKASWSGSLFLSAFTTKTTLYVLIRSFPGTELLIWLGLAMVIYGIVFAVRENDIRRVLAYAIINQVGFIMVGIGIGTEVALAGAAAQAFIHIIYKGLLFMTAGAVMYQTGKQKFTELGGLASRMPWLTGFAIIGAATTVAFPFTGSFVTKSLILKGAYAEHMGLVWLLLAGASVGAFLNAGLKYPYFVFFHKRAIEAPRIEREMPKSMFYAMSVMAILCVVVGLLPETFYGLLQHKVKYAPYTFQHVFQQLQYLGFGALGFYIVRGMITPREGRKYDTDLIYREIGIPIGKSIIRLSQLIWTVISNLYRNIVFKFVEFIRKLHGYDASLAKSWPTSLMTLWAAVILVLYLGVFVF